MAESLVAFKLGEGVDEGGGEKQLAVPEKLRPYPHDTAHLSWRLDLIPPPGPPAAGQAGALAAEQAAGEAAAAAAALVKTRVLLCRALDLPTEKRAPDPGTTGGKAESGATPVWHVSVTVPASLAPAPGAAPGAAPRPRRGSYPLVRALAVSCTSADQATQWLKAAPGGARGRP